MAEDEGEAKMISLSLRGGESQHQRWKEAAGKYYGGNLSSMIVNLVEEFIEKKSRNTPESLGLRGAIQKTHDEVKDVKERIENMNVYLRGREDGSEAKEAARKILELILDEGEMTATEIHGELDSKYGSEAIDGALALLNDLRLGGFKLKNSEGGEK